MEEPKGFSEYKARFPDYFPADAPLEKQWKVYEAVAGRMRQVDNAAHMTKVAAAVQVDRTKELNKIEEEALSIYQSGKFIQHCKKVFNGMWVGDEFILEALLYTAANLRVKNTKEGMHLHIGGDTQTGKSESCRTALNFLDPYNCMLSTMSPKYIYYGTEDGSIHEQLIIIMDDTTINDEVREIYRGILTSWDTGSERNIVVQNKPIKQKVPARVSMILTTTEAVVADSEDGQDESRFMTINIRRTQEQMAAIQRFIQEERPKPTAELELIRAVWKHIPNYQEVKQHRILDYMPVPAREFRRFLSLMKAHALLCARTETNEEDILAVQAFLTYSKPMINSTTAGLTNKEEAVKAVMGAQWMTVREISMKANMTVQAVNKALRGKEGSYEYPKGGLLSKLPDIERDQQKESENGNAKWMFRRRVGETLF